MQATCTQPEAGQDRHRRGCKGLKPQQHAQSPTYGYWLSHNMRRDEHDIS